MRDDKLVAARVGPDLVVYDEATKTAHCLSSEVASIWELCDGRRRADEIATSLQLSPETVEQALQEFAEAGLLVEETGYSRREAAKRFAAVGGVALAAPLMYSVAVPSAAAACSILPICTSTISHGFNATAIAQGNFVWWNAVVTTSGFTPTDGETLNVTNGVINLTDNKGGTHQIIVPDSVIAFSSAVTFPVLTFDTVHNRWLETVPTGGGGNFFLTGVAWPTPNGDVGGSTFTWTETFSITGGTLSTAGISWKFGAAVYPASTNFDTNYNGAEVKPSDSSGPSPYNNADHAGTPEAFKTQVLAGAQGGGAANFTGSYSPTASCTANC